eukprot:UN02479
MPSWYRPNMEEQKDWNNPDGEICIVYKDLVYILSLHCCYPVRDSSNCADPTYIPDLSVEQGDQFIVKHPIKNICACSVDPFEVGDALLCVVGQEAKPYIKLMKNGSSRPHTFHLSDLKHCKKIRKESPLASIKEDPVPKFKLKKKKKYRIYLEKQEWNMLTCGQHVLNHILQGPVL